MIPAPKKLSVFKPTGSTPNHPISRDEIDAIDGPYLEFAKTWVPEPVGTSSRARVDAADLAIALPIVKFCSQKMNKDGTMPTARIKAIWDKLFEDGEIDRAFDYHRWKVIRDLIEVQGGLEMEDRHFYTGFVNDQGQEIRGLAAKWKMADWLVEKLDEIAESGYQEVQEQPNNENSLKLQQNDQREIQIDFPENMQGGTLLEQEYDQDDDNPFDHNWIIEFRQEMAPEIGLIWGGSIENMRRETG